MSTCNILLAGHLLLVHSINNCMSTVFVMSHVCLVTYSLVMQVMHNLRRMQASQLDPLYHLQLKVSLHKRLDHHKHKQSLGDHTNVARLLLDVNFG